MPHYINAFTSLRSDQTNWQCRDGGLVRNAPSITTIPLTNLVARTFILALHAFRLLYLRTQVNTRRKWLILSLGWLLVVFVASIGPLEIQNTNNGPTLAPQGSGMLHDVYLNALLIRIEGAGSRSRTRSSRYAWNTCW